MYNIYNISNASVHTSKQLSDHVPKISITQSFTCSSCNNITTQETNFNDIDQFTEWKDDLERQTHSSFVLKCAPVKTIEYKTWYYYCNRAGVYKPQGYSKRQLKTQGSAKIGCQCSAYIKASQHLINKNMNVRYCSTHYNHDLQLAFLKMPSNARLDIARKLQIGVAVERILDDIRDTCDGGINREHLITRQDIRNIKLQYNIEGVMGHKNNLNSVILWVREMQSTLGYNPVLLFKEQGTEQPQGLDNFSDNDFILCLQTQFQRDMFTELGSNVVCVDATHGTNMYDFNSSL